MQRVYKEIKTKYWVFIVLLLSSLCYLPMLLENFGVNVPKGLLNIKYLFVILPFLVSVLFKAREKNLRKWFVSLFSKNSMATSTLVCTIFAVVGLSISYIYSLIGNSPDLFINTYPNISSIIIASIYLFVMALFEEMAWRGFLLNRISVNKRRLDSLGYVGVIWALWHLPMWLIRNSLGYQEIIVAFVWAILVSIVLGTLYFKCRNILVIAFLHMIFNLCFIAPMKYNVIILAVIITIIGIKNRIQRRFEENEKSKNRW